MVDLASLQERHLRVSHTTQETLARAQALMEIVSTAPWRSRSGSDTLRREVEGLRAAMASRAVIEQAKGIIMATAHCTADEAFDLLKQQSQYMNRKLRDIACDLVADTARKPSSVH
jgi:AmiR/NasT family two-component response regulator